jgi:hypothetical protein
MINRYAKNARKNYYVVKDRMTGKILSTHYKLSCARKAVSKYPVSNYVRVYNQDGKCFA